ncbi:MAG TPA: hypothetical protein VFV31_06005, partial [Chitinophagaceae bacterium]|nr:hypothetical protein [Chitinophagaceae bacterium]
MQPKFTLNSLRKVFAGIICFSMVLVVSTQVSLGQITEQMRKEQTLLKDAFIDPPPATNAATAVMVNTAKPNSQSSVVQRVVAPTTIATPPPPTYPGNNSRGNVNSFVSFIIRNTNAFDMKLTQVNGYFDPTVIGGTVSGSNMTLWYSTTSLSGVPVPLSGPTWLSAGTGTLGTVSTAGVYTCVSGLSLVIPAGATYRFALQSTRGLTYSGTGTGVGTPSPNNFTGDGVVLGVGDFQVAGLNVGYAGDAPTGTTFTARYFMGSIEVDRATCTPVAAEAPIISPLPANTCAGSSVTLSVIGGNL